MKKEGRKTGLIERIERSILQVNSGELDELPDPTTFVGHALPSR
jgi:hypothetical protein